MMARYHVDNTVILNCLLLQVLNLTELELNRVDIRVGLSGALYFMNGSPQAVRQLRNLVSQVFSSLQICACFSFSFSVKSQTSTMKSHFLFTS